MAPERIAVATIVVCIGILLLSACGIPLRPPPRARPVVLGGDFVVLAPDQSELLTGRLFNTTDPANVLARVTFRAPGCLQGQAVLLSGALHPTLTLASWRDTGPRVALRSTTPPVYGATDIRVLPFTGRLTVSNSCGDLDLPVEVRLIPAP